MVRVLLVRRQSFWRSTILTITLTMVRFMLPTIGLTIVLTYASLGYCILSPRHWMDAEWADHGFPHLWLKHVLCTFAGRTNYYRISYSNLRDDLIFWFMISAPTVFLSMAFPPFSRLLLRVRKPIDQWIKRMKLCKIGAIIGVFWGFLGSFIFLELSRFCTYLGLGFSTDFGPSIHGFLFL